MKLLLVDNIHLYKTPNGHYYSPTIYDKDFFQRYLQVFDSVRVCAKTQYVESLDESCHLLVSQDNLEIFELPWYQGLLNMVKVLPQLLRKSRSAINDCDCSIFRIAQAESFFIYLFSSMRGKPVAVEVVNDPDTLFKENAILRFFSLHMMKKMLYRANGAAYITTHFLQEKYPSRARLTRESESYFEGSFSTIELDEEDFGAPKIYSRPLEHLNMIHVANVIYDEKKGHRTVLQVLKILLDVGYSASVRFIGDGPALGIFQEYAVSLGVDKNVVFLGRLHNKKDVMDEMKKADLFIFPSHSEGMGRVNIEAQAVGLPCLASKVGGVVELFADKYLFDPLDAENYAQTIMRFFQQPEEMEKMSRENIVSARYFAKSKMTAKRRCFYLKLKRLAEKNQGVTTEREI